MHASSRFYEWHFLKQIIKKYKPIQCKRTTEVNLIAIIRNLGSTQHPITRFIIIAFTISIALIISYYILNSYRKS